MSEVEAGWYPDPEGKPCDRYWDGEDWTSKTRPRKNYALGGGKLTRRKVGVKSKAPAGQWSAGQILIFLSTAILALAFFVASTRMQSLLESLFDFGVAGFAILSVLAFTRYAKAVPFLLTWWYMLVVLDTLLSRPRQSVFRSDFDSWGFLVPSVCVFAAWTGFYLLQKQKFKPTSKESSGMRKVGIAALEIVGALLLGFYFLGSAVTLATEIRLSSLNKKSGNTAEQAVSLSAHNEQDFLTYVRDMSALVQDKSISDASLLQMGKTICKIYSNNGTTEQIASVMFPYTLEHGFAEVTIFTSALTVGSTQHLCPENISKVLTN